MGADWKMWRRSSLARSLMCISSEVCEALDWMYFMFVFLGFVFLCNFSFFFHILVIR